MKIWKVGKGNAVSLKWYPGRWKIGTCKNVWRVKIHSISCELQIPKFMNKCRPYVRRRVAELKQEALNAGLLSSVGRGRGGGRGATRGRGAPWAPRGAAAYSFMRSGTWRLRGLSFP